MFSKRLVAVCFSSASLVFFGQAFPQNGTWATKAPIPATQGNMRVGVVDGVLYVAGSYLGNPSFQAYDAATDTWTPRSPLPFGCGNCAVAVVGDTLYALGGGFLRNTLQAYDPATNTWTIKAPMPTARGQLGAGVVNGILYAVGGTVDGTVVATVEAYDPATNRWTPRAPLPAARYELAVVGLDDVLYAVAGADSRYTVTSTLYAYDPATNSWTTGSTMAGRRGSLAAVAMNGLLYAVGGYGTGGDPSGALASLHAYDPATRTWTFEATMPTARYYLAAGVADGVLYAIGGINATGELDTVEAFTPCDDDDRDNVCDEVDNCLGYSNSGQHDADGDGVGDGCDNCLVDANPGQDDADRDDLGDACDLCVHDAANDADGDRVCGDVDNCAAVANPDQTDADHDGRGDPCDPCAADPADDADGDGLCCDGSDACCLSDLGATVTVLDCDSGVPNTYFTDGCTIADHVAGCRVGSGNHGEFVSCVARLTEDLAAQQLIHRVERARIQRCAARSDPRTTFLGIRTIQARPQTDKSH